MSKYQKLFLVLKEAIVYIAISMIIIFCVRHFIVQHVKVEGSSMNPTLVDGQHLLIEKISYRFKDIDRFDIVVFKPFSDEKDVFYVKRVIGLPGETIQIKDDIIYINGKPLEENYSEDIYIDGKMAKKEITLGKDDYFVLGDNRDVSKDSREKEIGLLDSKSVVGRVWFSIYPTDRVGIVHN